MATLPFPAEKTAELRDMNARQTWAELLKKPRQVLLTVILLGTIIFVGELCVMFLLMAFPVESPLYEAFIDSGVLIILVSPALYTLFYLPVRRRVEALYATKSEIRALSQKLMQISEEEQRRLALDLHDEFAQTLSAMKLEVDALGNSIPSSSPQLQRRCSSLQKRTVEMHDSVRRIVARLRPTLLDDLGIGPALENLINDLEQSYPHVDFDLRVSGVKHRPPINIETALYRICQEGLTNALKHSSPGHVEIRLTSSYPELILQIRDDGCGFDTKKKTSVEISKAHFGLLGMRERATSLGGRFTLSSRPAQGTTLRIVFPLEDAS